jgi:hypothetical protein
MGIDFGVGNAHPANFQEKLNTIRREDGKLTLNLP